jgi:predicted acetyltransferase
LRIIKKIPYKDFAEMVVILTNAFAGFGVTTDEERKKIRLRLARSQRDDRTTCFYGLYEDGKLIGIMRHHDFSMNFVSTQLPVGGVGQVAVDLLHKKEKVCKELITYYLKHYRGKGVYMAALYPFRPDFYRKMGFGYGAKANVYRIKPADLPQRTAKKNIRFLRKKDRASIMACYNRYAEKTHGMMKKCLFEMNWLFRQNPKIVGVKKGNKLLGYVAFKFKTQPTDNFLDIELHIIELIYDNREVFFEIITFLRSQADQVNHMIYSTQDDSFHFLPSDPRNDTNELIPPVAHVTNLQGVGIMYRIIDIAGFFEALKNHSFGNQNCRLKLTLTDSFCPWNDGCHIIHFVNGRPRLRKSGDYEVEIKIDIADFSSLVMGVVNFTRLYEYGLAEISNSKYLDMINILFATGEKPVCKTDF